MRPAAVLLAAGLGLAGLAGCSSVGDLVGAASGTAAAAGTVNPALGAAVGIGTRAAVDWAARRVSLRWRRTEQEALAAQVEGMAPGEVRGWQARHFIPFGGRRGLVRLVRVVETPLADCREVLFSVESEENDGRQRSAWFLTSACRGSGGWRWASAEPAVERWGSLQ